ncbi:hypothetical protein G6L37_07340 [Agrobacterium rubi]|nr:hypothetical protein [Agrobacterium rubi]NTF25181.1 hypothetical protein [Agrobacterium rubi]
MKGFISFNPERGFHPFVHTVAYCLDVDPRVFGDEETAVIRQVFDTNARPGDAEAAIRPILERKGLIQ